MAVDPVKALVAIDPGTNTTGVAIFYNSALVSCLSYKRGDRSLEQFALQVRYGMWQPRSRLVIEFPQIYRASKSKGDPNGLTKLAYFIGLIVGADGVMLPELIKPADWAGQIPKATTRAKAGESPRAKRIRSRLAHDEAVVVDWTCDDTIDAVGIGLFALGRLKPTKVYPGATP